RRNRSTALPGWTCPPRDHHGNTSGLCRRQVAGDRRGVTIRRGARARFPHARSCLEGGQYGDAARDDRDAGELVTSQTFVEEGNTDEGGDRRELRCDYGGHRDSPAGPEGDRSEPEHLEAA